MLPALRHDEPLLVEGMASYLSVEVDGEVNLDAAWSYPEPSRAARNINDQVAFWKGI